MSIDFVLNGKQVTLDIDPNTSLLEALRNDLELSGPRFGCGLAQCGACTVMLEGNAIRSCVMPLASIQGKQVTTLEGLGSEDAPHPVQEAFIEHQAMQCGYCTNGVIVTAAAFLEKNPNANQSEIKEALYGNLCRCGAQPRMLKAIESAAIKLAKKA